MPLLRDVVYPIFLECRQFTTETFWENIFEDLAYGKAPYGTYITKDFLCCSYKDKDFSYKIDSTKDPNQIYNDVSSLLINKLGLLSQKEKMKKRLDFSNIEEQIKESRKNWSSIRKKNIKDLLIENYVIDMKNKYFLTTKQTHYLHSIIFIAMTFKIINPKDIDYSNGKINHIEGISFSKKTIVLERAIYDKEISFAPQIIIDKKLMSDNWPKYIENLNKISE